MFVNRRIDRCWLRAESLLAKLAFTKLIFKCDQNGDGIVSPTSSRSSYCDDLLFALRRRRRSLVDMTNPTTDNHQQHRIIEAFVRNYSEQPFRE